jgi:hypothetical protein
MSARPLKRSLPSRAWSCSELDSGHAHLLSQVKVEPPLSPEPHVDSDDAEDLENQLRVLEAMLICPCNLSVVVCAAIEVHCVSSHYMVNL